MKAIKLTILGATTLILLGFVIYFYFGNSFTTGEKIIHYSIPSLDQDAINVVQERLVGYKKTISELKPEQKIQKINYLYAIAADQRILGQYDSAKSTFEELLTLSPSDPNLIQSYASLLNIMGYKNLALDQTDKAIKLMPNNEEFWIFKIELMKDQIISERSIQSAYEEALKSTSQNTNLKASYEAYLKANNVNKF